MAERIAALGTGSDGDSPQTVRDYVEGRLRPGARVHRDIFIEEYTAALSDAAQARGMHLVGAEFRGPRGAEVDLDAFAADASKAWETAWGRAHQRHPVPDEVDLISDEEHEGYLKAADKALSKALKAQEGQPLPTEGDEVDRMFTKDGEEVFHRELRKRGW